MGVGRSAEGPCQKLQVDHVGPLGPGTHGYRTSVGRILEIPETNQTRTVQRDW
ncbi:hypothetical protein SnRVgp1 [Snakehead retrovirus]|uniref:hypothetical protein n=1 Tax=Snakehead retrovirus TaxID=40270 RepID=UPI00000FF4AA|nr:hypothetical protein SnRVgp1 [Snakehead retrovirus]AAC54862.1 ORF1 protein [Snakehead retrovirus]